MMTVVIAVAVLLVLGAVFGAILAYAAKVFAVEKDPREEAILELLPGANCGGCGYAGCAGYAAAVVKGEAPVTSCKPGGDPTGDAIAAVMGMAPVDMIKEVATVRCTGCGADKTKYNYVGVPDCLSASRVAGGGALACDFGCLGFGTCAKVCPFDAIHMKDGIADVDEEKCKACGKCVDACPRHLIVLEPYTTKKHVSIPCSSKAKGPVVTQVCANGCIGCSLCAKACPKEAITIENFLAKIDYDKCIGCTLCAQKCPRGLITVDGLVPEKKPAAPKAAPAAPKAEEKAPEAPAAEAKAEEKVEEKASEPAESKE